MSKKLTQEQKRKVINKRAKEIIEYLYEGETTDIKKEVEALVFDGKPLNPKTKIYLREKAERKKNICQKLK